MIGLKGIRGALSWGPEEYVAITPFAFSTARFRSRFASNATSTTRSTPARAKPLIAAAGSPLLRFTTRSAPASRATFSCSARDEHRLPLDAAVLEQAAVRRHAGDAEARSRLEARSFRKRHRVVGGNC